LRIDKEHIRSDTCYYYVALVLHILSRSERANAEAAHVKLF